LIRIKAQPMEEAHSLSSVILEKRMQKNLKASVKTVQTTLALVLNVYGLVLSSVMADSTN